jgi:hypothetical protein
MLVEGAGGGDDLEGGAGLVDVGDRDVALSGERRGVVAVEVEGRIVGECEDRPGVGVADDDRGALGLELLRDRLQLLLGDVLDVLVDGEDDVEAVGGGNLAAAELRELAAVAVALGLAPAGLPRR